MPEDGTAETASGLYPILRPLKAGFGQLIEARDRVL